MKRLSIIFVIFLTFFTHFAQKGLDFEPSPVDSVIPSTKFDAVGEAKEILNKVCAQYESFKSMKVDYIINTERGSIRKSDTIIGTVQGDKYRISTKDEEIACDGKITYFYHKIQKKLTKKKAKPEAEVFYAVYPQKMLRSYEQEFDCYFNGEASFNGQIIQRLEFIPRAFDQNIMKINVFIDRRSSQILRVSRTDKDGTQYTLDFRNVLFDIKVNPKTFVIEIS